MIRHTIAIATAIAILAPAFDADAKSRGGSRSHSPSISTRTMPYAPAIILMLVGPDGKSPCTDREKARGLCKEVPRPNTAPNK